MNWPGTDGRSLVWVTRTDPFNRLTAKHLEIAGYNAVIAPALRVLRRDTPRLVAVPEALVFTSLQGIRLHRFLPSLADVPTFTVGDHSARLARARGYRHAVSAAGDVRDLCRLLHFALDAGSTILHIGAARPAGDLRFLLPPGTFHVRHQVVYDVVEAGPLDLEWVAGRIGEIDKILIHSPRAGQRIATWLEQEAAAWRGEIFCISPAAARPFATLSGAQIRVAAVPDERSLLAPLFSGSPG
ncbi:uroporphyrinogen III methyltransferase [Sphingomonas sp. DBB INV C78]